MAHFISISGVEAFQAWGEVDAECFDKDQDDLATHLEAINHHLYDEGRQSRSRAKGNYDKKGNTFEYKKADCVLVRPMGLNKAKVQKFVKPWIGPCKVMLKLSRFSYLLKSEVGGKISRSHSNKLRAIGDSIVYGVSRIIAKF